MKAAKDDPWLTVEEVAERLRIQPATIHTWRYQGTAPKGTKIGRRVLFRESDVIEWEHRREEAEQRESA